MLLLVSEKRLSYAELNGRANQVAHYLRRRGVREEDRVGVCLERSAQLVVVLLGGKLAWVLLIALAAVLSKRLPHDYRSRLRPSFWTLTIVKAFSGIYLALLVTLMFQITLRFGACA